MTEELLIKIAGSVGVLGLMFQAGTGIYRTYKEKYARPDFIIYRLDKLSDHGGENANSANPPRSSAS